MSSESLRDRDRPLLVALVDGGPGVGAGHLGRSLAVVEAWVDGGGRALLDDDQTLPDEWRERYAAAGAPTGTGAPDVLLVDGYDLDDRAVASRRGAAAVVSIDDRDRSGRRAVDLAVDVEPPAGGSTTRATSVRPLRCTGPRYALLRREVVAAAGPSPRPDAAEGPPLRLVVAMGGAPTAAVRAALSSAVRELEATTDLAVTWLQGRDDVGAVLAASDLALSAAGSTAWELALHGVPAALVPVADNQVPVAAAVAAAGAAVVVDDLDPGVLAATVRDLAADPSRRRAMAAAGRSLVDGRGASRIAAAARSLLVRLRPAIADDAGLLWAWANDPATRAAAFDPSPIPWDDHVAWLGDRIADPHAGVWVAEDLDGAPLGQVRVELEGDGDGRVSIVVAPERRGRGWAAPILSAAAREACDSLGARGLRRLRAEVLPGNDRSAAAFTSADFDRAPDGLRSGRAHRTYTRRCDG